MSSERREWRNLAMTSSEIPPLHSAAPCSGRNDGGEGLLALRMVYAHWGLLGRTASDPIGEHAALAGSPLL